MGYIGKIPTFPTFEARWRPSNQETAVKHL